MGAVENFFTRVIPGRRDAANRSEVEEEPAAPPPPSPSWGLSAEHLGAGYDANDIYFGERARDLDYKGAFFYARVHDQKGFDMNGTPLAAPPKSFPGSQGFLAQQGGNRWIPISQRRPNAPYRIPRTIVKAFTGMLFGQQRWPGIRSDDEQTQAWCEAVVKVAQIRNRFTRGRNMGGAQGTVGFSWTFRAGKPVVRVHAGRFVQCLDWEDPDDLIPSHVTELFRTMATRQTPDGPQRYEVWVRRDWTPEADVVFKPVEATPENPSEWVIDEERSNPHGDGFCHFVWAVNIPDDEDPSAVDGQPDYAELYEQMETLDGSNSVLVRGVTLNLDPTLVIKRDNPEDIKVVQKGSDNSIVTNASGDAKYLTLEAGIVDTGEKLVTMQRRQILEVAQCIVADPNEVAAAGTSSLTMKLVYAPMIGATELLRETYGPALVRLLEQMQKSALRMMGEELPGSEASTEPTEARASVDGGQPPEVFEHEDLDPVEQEPVEPAVAYYLDLPARVVAEPVLAEDGTPTGEVEQRKVEQHPGFGKIELEWGEYFATTADEKQKTLASLSASTGGRSVLSQKTAVEMTAGILNKEATDEWERVAEEGKRQRFDVMSPGGSVATETELPDGAEPAPTDASAEPAPVPARPPPVETEPEFVDVQKQALNGAQVTSMLEVVAKVASDEIPAASAIEILVTAFNMDRDLAKRIINPVEEENESGPRPPQQKPPVMPPVA